jgi:hypothetical protein
VVAKESNNSILSSLRAKQYITINIGKKKPSQFWNEKSGISKGKNIKSESWIFLGVTDDNC